MNMEKNEMTLEMKLKKLEEIYKIYTNGEVEIDVNSDVAFEHDDVWIVNPFTECSGRLHVNPIEEYGIENIKEFIRLYEEINGELI